MVRQLPVELRLRVIEQLQRAVDERIHVLLCPASRRSAYLGSVDDEHRSDLHEKSFRGSMVAPPIRLGSSGFASHEACRYVSQMTYRTGPTGLLHPGRSASASNLRPDRKRVAVNFTSPARVVMLESPANERPTWIPRR